MSEINPPDRSIPEEFRQEVARLEIEAVQRFNIRRFDESRQLYQQILEILNKACMHASAWINFIRSQTLFGIQEKIAEERHPN